MQLWSIRTELNYRNGLNYYDIKLWKMPCLPPIDYKVFEDTVLQPDLLVVCGKIEKKFLDFPPALVVEILSPSTAMKDRHTKFPIYESQGVKYFGIISPEKEIIEIYENESGEYTLKSRGFPDKA